MKKFYQLVGSRQHNLNLPKADFDYIGFGLTAEEIKTLVEPKFCDTRLLYQDPITYIEAVIGEVNFHREWIDLVTPIGISDDSVANFQDFHCEELLRAIKKKIFSHTLQISARFTSLLNSNKNNPSIQNRPKFWIQALRKTGILNKYAKTQNWHDSTWFEEGDPFRELILAIKRGDLSLDEVIKINQEQLDILKSNESWYCSSTSDLNWLAKYQQEYISLLNETEV